MRIGILGGTFNPPHIAHLVCAQEAMHQLALDRVMLMVAGDPPHKPVDGGVSAQLRCRMTQALADADERLELCDIELHRAGPSYTVDTLTELRARHPGDQLVLIIGGDQALAFGGWRQPQRILEMVTLVCCEREGSLRDTVREQMSALAGGDRVRFFDMPRLDLSSSLIRRRVSAGQPIRYLVPDAVERIIHDHGLYRSGA